MKSLEESVVSVLGLGLLGGSLAWRLASKSAARGVAGWSRNPATVEAAAARGMITRACASAEECASLGDVIVLAVPVRSMLELSRSIVKSARRDAAVFDLGSTKITAIIGEVTGDSRSWGLRILGVGSERSTGVRRGVIRDFEETVRAGERAYAEAGIKITSETLPWQAAAPGTQ